MTENRECMFRGDSGSAQQTYTFPIDHRKCGSRVDPANRTVTNSIIVQENAGILTASTRRFQVVCNYHADMLTVRASFTVPNKNGNTDEAAPKNPHDTTRRGREHQPAMVGRMGLVLKEDEINEYVAGEVTKLDDDQGTDSGRSSGYARLTAYEERSERIIQKSDRRDHKFNAIFIGSTLLVIMAIAVAYLVSWEIKKRNFQHARMNFVQQR